MPNTNDSVFTFTWKIINYSSNGLILGEYIRSPLFNSVMLRNTKWYLKVYPSGYDSRCKDYFACYLCRNSIDSCEEVINISYKIEVSDLNGKIFLLYNGSSTFSKGSGFGTKSTLKIQQLSDIEQRKNNTLIVRCYFLGKSVTNQNVMCDACTEIRVEECSYKWNVQFSNSPNCSKELSFCYQESTRFEITLFVSDNKVHIIVGKIEEQVASRNVKLRISAFKYEGAKIKFTNNVHLFKPTANNDILEFKTFIDKDQIADEDYCSYYSFILKCEVSSSTGYAVSNLEGYDFGEIVLKENVPSIEEPRQTLQNDLRNMLLTAEHCDVKLRVEDKVIPAHKCLLSARSPVLSAMFKQDMSENRLGIVDIVDVEAEVLQSFLEFIYSETLTNTGDEHILKLILVADKYQVPALKERCFPILKSSLTVKNACQMILVADLINHKKLKTLVMNFIKENKKEVLFLPEWFKWVDKNTKLGIQILMKLSTD